MRVAFRFKVSSGEGYGHAMRSVTLAQELSRAAGARIKFFASCDEASRSWLTGIGRDFELVGQPPGDYLTRLVRYAPDVVIWDLPQDVPAAELERLRSTGALTVLIDNLGSARCQADLCFVPTQAAANEGLWREATGKHFCGPDYALVRRSIAAVKPAMPVQAYRVMVTTGGSDPDGVTLRIIDSLERVGRPLLVDLVVGFGFQHFGALAAKLASVEGMYYCHFGVKDMAALMKRAHLAVATYGSVVYELAAAGLPAVLVARNRTHAGEAEEFCKLGCAVSVGEVELMEPAVLVSAVERLCGSREARLKMSQAGKSAVDGRGARRTARVILRELKLRHASGRRREVGFRCARPLESSSPAL